MANKTQEGSLVRARTELIKLPAAVQAAVRGILAEAEDSQAYKTVRFFEQSPIGVAQTVLKYAEAAVRARDEDDNPEVSVEEALGAGGETD